MLLFHVLRLASKIKACSMWQGVEGQQYAVCDYTIYIIYIYIHLILHIIYIHHMRTFVHVNSHSHGVTSPFMFTSINVTMWLTSALKVE